MVGNYSEAHKSVERAVKAAREAARETFAAESTPLLNSLGIESFSWTQYTPHFNDGDECVFCVYTDHESIIINGVRFYDCTNLDWAPAYPTAQYNTPEYKALHAMHEELLAKSPYQKVSEFLMQFSKDDLRHIFGDPVTVTVSKDGAAVEPCEHD